MEDVFVPNSVRAIIDNSIMIIHESSRGHFDVVFQDLDSNILDAVMIRGWTLCISKENPNVILYSKEDLLFQINLDFQFYLDARHYFDVIIDYFSRIEKCTSQEELDAIKEAELQKRRLDRYVEMITRLKMASSHGRIADGKQKS